MNILNSDQISVKKALDELTRRYNNLNFIDSDPIQVPHKFNRKEDIEVSGFLTAIIAWGQRKTIINNGFRIINMMDNAPYDFIKNHTLYDLKNLSAFCHRTFNSSDLIDFIKVLQKIYQEKKGLEGVFNEAYTKTHNIKEGIIALRSFFADNTINTHTLKHIANVEKGSSAKRINMFLRWMIRNDNQRVDFGLWKNIPMSALYIPLDVHTGNSARENGLLKRKQNDWKAVEELTQILRKFDPQDPVKYDYALFGMGVFA